MNNLSSARPKISVIILNYNGRSWLERCFASLEKQTFFPQIEVILTDNKSHDDSVEFANHWLAHSNAKGRVVQNGANLFYCEANNNGAAVAMGEFLLFLNNDTWLEPDCLENLYNETVKAGAAAAAPFVMDYDDETFQSGGVNGMDLFGMITGGLPSKTVQETIDSPGCSLFISAETFHKIGGFAPELLIYVDETDLAWRVWISGGKIVTVPSARVHHRGAAVVNPEGKTKAVESRTTETKRFLTNRNQILLLVKNSQHVLFLLLISCAIMLFAEAVVSLILIRRWSYIRNSYWSAFIDVWRMRRHICEWRRRIRSFRKRGDFWMLRFLRLKPSRWSEVVRLFKLGPPKVDAK